MNFFPDFSPILKNFNLIKTIDSILNKNFDFVREMHKYVSENFSPANTAKSMLKSSLELYIPKEITPEVGEYLSRMALRTLVGLPIIGITVREVNAIKELEGSISWLTKDKIDVTELIRRLREGE